jgi:hypothetical protein
MTASGIGGSFVGFAYARIARGAGARYAPSGRAELCASQSLSGLTRDLIYLGGVLRANDSVSAASAPLLPSSHFAATCGLSIFHRAE